MDAKHRNWDASSSCQSVGGASWDSSSNKRRRFSKVVPDEIPTEGDNDLDPHLVTGESRIDWKNKQIMCSRDQQKQVASIDLTGSSATNSSENPATSNSLAFPESDLLDFDDDGEDEEYDYNEDIEDYDFAFETESTTNDYNQYLASQFDDLDLPPGVEATVPWLRERDSSAKRPTDLKLKEVIDEVKTVIESFKKFDTVQDSSNHHFECSEVQKTSKEWAKRIQHEWKLLEKDLPDSIYVRAYEDRMDLLRAAITGPAGTPYHDGLFFFDIQFPSDYPHSPPMVHHHSGGLQLNPNLYPCGRVCLSLLNTWIGRGCEKWSESMSTMLQVLVSIQALVLNERPYFNEPGLASSANMPSSEINSMSYNRDVFLLSCRRMLYSLRNPPKHFEDLVTGHFREHGRAILESCKAYMKGAPLGSVVKESKQEASAATTNTEAIAAFHGLLEKLFEELLMEFSVKGADCTEFLREKGRAPTAARKANLNPVAAANLNDAYYNLQKYYQKLWKANEAWPRD